MQLMSPFAPIVSRKDLPGLVLGCDRQKVCPVTFQVVPSLSKHCFFVCFVFTGWIPELNPEEMFHLGSTSQRVTGCVRFVCGLEGEFFEVLSKGSYCDCNVNHCIRIGVLRNTHSHTR